MLGILPSHLKVLRMFSSGYRIDQSREQNREREVILEYLLKIRTRVESIGARFMILVIPADYQICPDAWQYYQKQMELDSAVYDLTRIARRFQEFSQTRNIPVLIVSDRFRLEQMQESLYFDYTREIHLNIHGNHILADEIERFIDARGLLDSTTND